MTKQGCRNWVRANILIGIEPKRKSKYLIVYPFSSNHAKEAIIEHLAVQLHKLLNEL